MPARTVSCRGCGEAFYTNASGRPAVWCSRKCKDAAKTAANRERLRKKLAARQCANCGGPLPDTASGKARTCSRACGVAWQNAKRATRRRKAWLASDPRCERCGEPIPESRRAGVKFCSWECKHLAAGDRWRERVPGYQRQRLYGITREQYLDLLAKQDGCCAICRTDEWTGKGPHVDHCHETGAVRGILCHKCNLGLGKFDDDPSRLRVAAGYLEAPSPSP